MNLNQKMSIDHRSIFAIADAKPNMFWMFYIKNASKKNISRNRRFTVTTPFHLDSLNEINRSENKSQH